MNKNKKQNVTDYVQYKLDNPDYQIPIIQDRPFKATIMGFKVFTLKIIAEILGLKYEDIKESYFVSNELPLNQDIEKESILDTLIATGKYSYVNLEANNYKSDPSIMKNLTYGYRLILSKLSREIRTVLMAKGCSIPKSFSIQKKRLIIF